MFVDSVAIDFFANDVVLAKVNAEVDTVLAQQYHVRGYPTSVLMDKDGQEIDRIVGYKPAEEFLQTIRDYANGIGTLDDLLRRAETESDRTLFSEIADKYKYRGGSEEALAWYSRVLEAGDPRDSLAGETRTAIADLFRRDRDYDRALEEFSGIAEDFAGTMYAQDAEIYKAIIYHQKGDTATAIEAFEGYIEHYPESEDVEYAQSQIEKLKNPAAGDK